MRKLTKITKTISLTIQRVECDPDEDFMVLYFTNNSYIKIKAIAADGLMGLGYLQIGGDKAAG